MAVEVILMMASRRFKIFGSGTSTTRTSFLPYQQFAFITPPWHAESVRRLKPFSKRGKQTLARNTRSLPLALLFQDARLRRAVLARPDPPPRINVAISEIHFSTGGQSVCTEGYRRALISRSNKPTEATRVAVSLHQCLRAASGGGARRQSL